MKDTGSNLQMSHFNDNHWRYRRREGQSIILSPRPHQSTLEPVTIRSKGAPRRNGGSTCRGLSAFERSVPPSNTAIQTTVLILSGSPVITLVSVSMPAPAPLNTTPEFHAASPTFSSPASRHSSPASTITMSINITLSPHPPAPMPEPPLSTA